VGQARRLVRQPHGSFYYHGLAGLVARGFRAYFRMRPKLAEDVRELFRAGDLETQRALYDRRIAPALWTPAMKWVLGRQFTLSLLGVPHPQRRLVQAQHPDGVAGFARDGHRVCVPGIAGGGQLFLARLRGGPLHARMLSGVSQARQFPGAEEAAWWTASRPHTCTVTEFLHDTKRPISRFVLLDHMDWMSSYHPAALVEEWNAILGRARRRTRACCCAAPTPIPPFSNWVTGSAMSGAVSKTRCVSRPMPAARLQLRTTACTPTPASSIADVPT
jgi:S-adenosylmethionine-diacylglycerol 3-amino-3-carboxypropyl transferase